MKIVRPSKSTAETQPHVETALLRLSAMIVQSTPRQGRIPCFTRIIFGGSDCAGPLRSGEAAEAVLIFHRPGRVSPRLIPGTRQSFALPVALTTQPQLQPALLRLSAMMSQYFTRVQHKPTFAALSRARTRGNSWNQNPDE